MPFSEIIVRYPFIILITISLFAGTCLIVPLTLKKIPNFADPQLGFETRGTVIAQRLTAWENLQKATKASGSFAVNPKDIMPPDVSEKIRKRKFSKKKKKLTMPLNPELFVVAKEMNYSENTSKSNSWKTLEELRKVDIKHREHNHKHFSKDGFFCGTPDERYSRIILSTAEEKTLFSYDSLMAMCYVEYQLTEEKSFSLLCDTITEKQCCHCWSLANYVALLHNRTSCLAITEEDVNATLALLQFCSPYYHNLYLIHDCSENERCQIPAECGEHNAVYNMLHYLTDTDFLPPNGTSQTFLRESAIFLPIGRTTKTIDYYKSLKEKNLNFQNIRLVAMNFGLKNALFDEYLIKDAWLIGSGGLCVFICMWIYTQSLFLTIMTIIAIAFSLAISYFMYTLVFELQFFPFMNLLATVVVIGIGADDAFIFCKVWQCHKIEKKSSMLRIVTESFHHAVLSMLVTSLTTTAAFYSSLISSITAVRCFSVFAGTAVIANFALMITWLPACLVISEKCCTPLIFSSQLTILENKLRPLRLIVDDVWIFLEKCLLVLTLKFRYLWFIVMAAIGFISVLIVLHYPGLQLPDFPEFQLFESRHPFEQYDLFYKQKFWFERLQKLDNSLSGNYKMPLRFVWGVLPIDNGDNMNPFSKGTLVLDPTFDIAAPESQLWLSSFCSKLKMQPFYEPTLGTLLPNCFIESFVSWMQRRCKDAIDGFDRTPCCETEKFPYAKEVFKKCIVDAMSDLYETPSEYFMPGVAGPKFSRELFPLIQAVVVEYDSNYSYSMSYTYMNKFFNEVENWTQEQLKTAPAGMKNGWFISELEFYDLQRELSESTLLAIVVAMVVSFLVLLLVTLNILISFFAIITISCSIFSTMSVLVLLGWKLNVLESIAVSTAIGLAVDFSLHYGINYRLFSVDNDRISATKFAISNMAGPTAMAALTTGTAGALMLPSSVLAYIQIGTFLVVVMGISWIYSTFMFNAMLSIIGPEYGFGQFKYPLVKKCREQRNLEPDNSSVDTRASHASKNLCSNVLSETTLSITSTVCAIPNSESHELDSITSKSLTRSKSSIRSKANNCQTVSGNTSKNYFSADHSPSVTSDTTIIMTEDD